MKNDIITWKVKGCSKVHSIPDKAIITVVGENGWAWIWVDEGGRVNIREGLDKEALSD